MYTISSKFPSIMCINWCDHGFNPESNQKEVFPKMLMWISFIDINNDMIKPSDNDMLESVVDCVTHRVLISDTTLRYFIPPQVRKMITKLRHICGWELCIIPKDMQIYLNRYRIILVPDLQQESIVRNTRTCFIDLVLYACCMHVV